MTIYFWLVLLAFLSAFSPKEGAAQEALKQTQCDIVKEEIITLKPPSFDTPTIWSALYGEEGMEQITDSVTAHPESDDDRHFIVIGTYTKDDEDQIEKPFITRLDNRGRAIWEKKEDVNFNKMPLHVLKTKTGYAVLGRIENGKGAQGGYLAFYAKNGERLRQYPLLEKGYALEVHGFAPSKTGKSYIVAASRSKVSQDKDASKDDGAPQSEVVLYKITTEGKRLWRRQYSPGLSTALHDIELGKDGHYTLSGFIEQDNGRKAGWVMRIDENGALIWQRPYPRGAMAHLKTVRTYEDGSIVTVGQVRGLQEKNKSAWIMKLSPSGDVVWQRYYQGNYNYNASDMLGHDDGRISVLIDSEIADKSRGSFDRGHANLLTFSPRGYLMNLESFTEGQRAQSMALSLGHYQERLVAGYAQSVMPDTMAEGTNMKSVFDGWIFAATALDPYDDPCDTSF